ncbi:MAG TPA: ATP-binding protein, partial [Albitalea sp.]|nr:ATP-binding protein [Albitalea sp.]
AYLGHICSLCCSLDARCHDLCKPDAAWSAQWRAAARWLLPAAWWKRLDTELGRYLLLMSAIVPALGLLFGAIYQQQLRPLADLGEGLRESAAQAIGLGFVKVYAALVVVAAIVTWWLVLTHKSRQVAQEESNRQTQALNEQAVALMNEIASHQRTDEALQQARRQAEAANQAKSRYISAISHELRTPLNSIIGYAQLLDEDESLPAKRRQAVSVIRRGGDHLLSLIEGTLDIARIEGGKLTLDVKPMRFAEAVQQIARMFELQAAGKGLAFRHEVQGVLPEVVRTDEKRMRQVLINVIGNAVKFTAAGEVVLRVSYAREMALFEVEDTGPGIAPHEMARVFEPFARGSAAGGSSGGGTGLGLTIGKMLTDLMGGEMTVHSPPPARAGGSLFRIRLFLPEVRTAMADRALPRGQRIGYAGARRRVLVVDNEQVDRELLVDLLAPLGFEVGCAASGEECLARLREHSPDAILMDLAMPGIDGWETIRRVRAQRLSAAPLAIVSANAFDKGLDNDVGVAATDFVLKPVRKSELLDWLGRALALEWLHAPAPAPTPAGDAAPLPEPDFVAPGEERLRALDEMLALGYLRGVTTLLDAIEAESPACRRFVDHLRALAQRFQLDAMSGVVRKARDARLAG